MNNNTATGNVELVVELLQKTRNFAPIEELTPLFHRFLSLSSENLKSLPPEIIPALSDTLYQRILSPTPVPGKCQVFSDLLRMCQRIGESSAAQRDLLLRQGLSGTLILLSQRLEVGNPTPKKELLSTQRTLWSTALSLLNGTTLFCKYVY